MPEAPRRILITGANLPLGMALVRAVLERGDTAVAIVPRPERVPALADLHQEVGPRLEIVRGDATAQLVPTLAAAVGAVDAMVHAALRRHAADALGDAEIADSLGEVTDEDFDSLVRANAWAMLSWTRACLPSLRRTRGSKLLVVVPWLAALSGKTHGGDYAYCSSLAARAMLTRALAADLAGEAISVAAVNPGNYKAEIEGPAFLHDVQTAATGILGVLEAMQPADAGCWRDWTGALRPEW